MTHIVGNVRTWGEMVKFSHSIFALPFALTATVMAGRHLPGGLPSAGQFGLIIVCMISARSFAMTFNRIADAKLDAKNPRTAGRPIPSGRISIASAWSFTFGSAALFIAGCAGFRWVYGNTWPVRLAAPVLLGLAAYSYMKRFTSAAHFFLGASIAVAPVAAWIAIDPGSVGWPTALLGGAVLFWIAGFDIIYACQDADVDCREGLHALPSRLGIGAALRISRMSHVLAVALLILLGRVGGFGWLYGSAVGVTAALLAIEQAMVKADDLSRVNLAFFTLNGCVSLAFGAAAVADILWTNPS